jgi:uncharacterized integral membrane protein
MKALYLILSIIFSAAVLYIAFENLNASCSSVKFFTYSLSQSSAIIILVAAVLGILTGASYHAFMSRVLSTPVDEEDDDI